MNKKGTLEFNLEDPYAKEDFEKALKANAAFSALHEVVDHVFRPARKHGYQDSEINDIINKCGPHGYELVGKLEKLYYSILEEYGVND